MATTEAIVICEDIAFCYQASNSGILLRYTGSAEELIDSGAIEPEMAEPRHGSKKARLDSHGYYYHSQRRATAARGIYWHVERWITDSAFAATLPGCPRLRFKELDWLDAHPGRILLRRTQEREDDRACIVLNRPPREIMRAAGSYEGLAASGVFPEPRFVPFMEYPSQAGKDPRYYSRGYSESESGLTVRFYWLMRGYFGIETERPIEGKNEETTQRPAGLRLVIDNTLGAPPND